MLAHLTGARVLSVCRGTHAQGAEPGARDVEFLQGESSHVIEYVIRFVVYLTAF